MSATRTGFVPVETVAATRPRGIIIVCDHARNDVPPEIGSLGLADTEMRRHIAWDPGARDVTLDLARRMEAGAVLSTFSRLVIDPNRGEEDPTLVMRLYDGTIVPGNARIAEAEVARRLECYHRPYHAALDAAIDAELAAGRTPVLISVHSFTPRLKGGGIRPWHVGVLWDGDGRIARPLIERLERESGLVVGDNEPYAGQLRGDCMWRHGTARGIAHVLIELRQDLISEVRTACDWAGRLAPVLEDVLESADLRPMTPEATPEETTA